MNRRSAKQHRLQLNEGRRAGLIGATSIWLWVLAVDAIAGEPFHTTAVLGRDLLGILLPGADASLLGGVTAFTLAHYALWIALGSLAVRAIGADARSPGVLLAAFNVLTLLQLALVGLTQIFIETQLGRDAWAALFGGNVIGSVLVGAYLLRRHPELPAQLRRDGDE